MSCWLGDEGRALAVKMSAREWDNNFFCIYWSCTSDGHHLIEICYLYTLCSHMFNRTPRVEYDYKKCLSKCRSVRRSGRRCHILHDGQTEFW